MSLSVKPLEQRDSGAWNPSSGQSFPFTVKQFYDLTGSGWWRSAGAVVNEHTCLTLSAVSAAVELKSGTLSNLDGEVKRHIEGKGKVGQPVNWVSQLFKNPNSYQNGRKFWKGYWTGGSITGNALAEIERDRRTNLPLGLHLIDWHAVKMELDKDGFPVYRLIRARDPKRSVLGVNDVLHTLIGPSRNGIASQNPIILAQENLGISAAIQTYMGTVFASGAAPRGVLKTSASTAEGLAAVRETWDTTHGGIANSNKIGIFGKDTEFIPIDMSPVDVAVNATREQQVAECARIFNVPYNLLQGVLTGSYSGNQEINAQWYNTSLHTPILSLEAEIDTKLIGEEDYYAGYHFKFDTKRFRGGYDQEVQNQSKLFLSGLTSQNQARENLGLNPVEDDDDASDYDKLHAPVNLSNMTEDPRKDDSQSQVNPTNDPVYYPTKKGGKPAPTDKPTGTPAVTEIQETALNGTQIESLLQIITSITQGLLPPESGKAAIQASFPTLSQDAVNSIISPLIGFKPTSLEPPAPPQADPSVDVDQAKRSIRAALTDAIGKAQRRQIKSKVKPMEFRSHLLELEPLVNTYRSLHNRGLNVNELADKWVQLDPNEVGFTETVMTFMEGD